jgi:L-lactate dehydrogenase complex protein LldF
VVHWARDATEANRIVIDLVRGKGVDEVVKVKSMATQEIGLNEALEAAGIAALETDLAELIVQLGHDKPSHILVPAIHRNQAEIREIFLREMADVDPALTDEPAALAAAARQHLRRKFLSAKVAISGANFGIAVTGTLGVVESEGNGRMCLTLPDTLITIMGIEKLVPRWQDLEVFLQLLPRSSTGERMNPYTSMWTGVTPGDGPQEFHLILLDNGRTAVLADTEGRDALNCIRCSACLNVCPVYERTGTRTDRCIQARSARSCRHSSLESRTTHHSRTRRRCVALVTTSAQSRSTSRRSWCTYVPSTPRRTPASIGCRAQRHPPWRRPPG